MKRTLLALLCVLALAVTMVACTTEPQTEPQTVTAETEAPDTDEPATGDISTDTEAPDTDEPATGDVPTDTEVPDTDEPSTDTPAGPTTRTKRTTPPSVTLASTTAITTKAGATLCKKDKVVDMNGFTFKFGTAWNFQTTVDNSTLPDFIWHYRMDEVMEEYNCKIKVEYVYGTPENIRAYVMANKAPAHVICMLYGSMFMPALGADYLMAWEDIPNSPIDLADARWATNQLNVSPFNGKLYGMNTVSTGVPNVRDSVFVNKTLIERNGLSVEELYTAVNQNKWNWELLRKYAIACTKDTDSDGKNNSWGIIGAPGFLLYDFPYSNNGGMVAIKNGSAVSIMNSPQNAEAFSFMDKLINVDKVVYFPEGCYNESTWGDASNSFDAVAEFLKGNYAFCFHEGWNFDQQLKPKAKFDYGYLPLPMGPQAKSYVSPAYNSSTDVILKSVKDVEKVAIIYNAWARPYQDVLDYRDEETAARFQKNDKYSYDLFVGSSKYQTLDYGAGVPAMGQAFYHAAVSSLLWHVQSPTAALESLSDSFSTEISAIYSGAAK